MEPKAQTLQQKMGFLDNDLKKPKHDELMIWLDTNIVGIVNKKFNPEMSDKSWSEFISVNTKRLNVFKDDILKRIDEYNVEEQERIDIMKVVKCNRSRWDDERDKKRDGLLEIIKRIDSFSFGDKPKRPLVTNVKKKWEIPVMSNKFTIGFIDFSAEFNIPELRLYIPDALNIPHDYIPTLKFEPYRNLIYIEVKTEIPSVGEVMRQINHYKEFIGPSQYVMCPDSKFKDILESQGIGWIDCEPF